MTHPLSGKLRGETINCSCHAYGASECGCDSNWPEHFCNEAADELDLMQDTLVEAITAYKGSRNLALEEAAKVAVNHGRNGLAQAIRALKETDQ
jgi:hypothetical protein